MTRSPIFVTDHAILRYLERVLGLNVENARRVIAAKTQEAHETGASAIVSGGFAYRIIGGNVVTVTPAKSTKLGAEK